MPFYNVTADEAKAISEFTERRTSRKTMTFIGGHKGPVKTTTEETTQEFATPYLDYVAGVVENVLRRHALTCHALTTNKSSCGAGTTDTPQEEISDTASASSAGERPYPFPSLFLHTPRQLVEMQDALIRPPKTTGIASSTQSPPHSTDGQGSGSHEHKRGAASGLSSVHCTPHMPPIELLYTHPCTPSPDTKASERKENGDGLGAESETSPAQGNNGSCKKMTSGRSDAEDKNCMMVPAPLPYDTANQFPPELHRHTAALQKNVSLQTARPMANVSLAPTNAPPSAESWSASAQQMVQVVLQAEASLLVAAPPPVTSLSPPICSKEYAAEAQSRPSATLVSESTVPASAAQPVSDGVDEAAKVAEVPFLFSPDATSCVIVACRVTLHPALQRALDAIADATLEAALHEKLHNDANSIDVRLRFLRACLKTATACMAHLDRIKGLVEVLHDMVWNSAVPAFVHAVHRHYTAMFPSATAEDSTTPATALQALQELLRAASNAAVAATAVSSESPNEELASLLFSLVDDSCLSFLHVDWYVVGGIRMKKSAAPVLESVFRAFFPSVPSASSSTSDTSLLKDVVELHDVVSPSRASVNSPEVAAAAAAGPTRLRVAHRLREDGLCFWSFNTTFQPWCVDPNPQQRYAYPMTWGLLLSVSTGHCWPATVQPGTRRAPLWEVRNITTEFGYRWITPQEFRASGEKRNAVSEAATRSTPKRTSVKNKAEAQAKKKKVCTAEVLKVVRNAVPTSILVQRLRNVDASIPPHQRLWSDFHLLPASNTPVTTAHSADEDSEPHASKLTLTLARYVQTVLDRQDTWWSRRLSKKSAVTQCSSEAAAATRTVAALRIFPVLIRSHASHLDNTDETKSHADGLVQWNRVPFDRVQNALAQPKVGLLNWSTTPHCEPPDFCDLTRNQLLWRVCASSSDVFVDGTDGLYVE